MIETCALRSGGWETVALAVPDLAIPRGLSGEYTERRSGQFGTEYTMRPEVLAELGSGVSDVRLQSRPGGMTRLKITGNASIAVHGPRGALGTISAGEACLGTGQIFDAGMSGAVAAGMVSTHAPIESGMVRIPRLDPSITIRTPSDDYAHALLDGLASVLMRERRSGQRLRTDFSGDLGHSVYLGQRSKNSERMVRGYHKSAQALVMHPEWAETVPPGLVRIEAELTGRLRAGKVLTMADMPDLGGLSEAEVAEMSKWLVEAAGEMALVSVSSLVSGQVELGEAPNGNEAVQLIGVWQIINARGIEGLISLGVSRTSAYRKRARIDALLAAAFGTPEQALNAATLHALTYLAADAAAEL